jgi:hypothetical protein
MQSERKLFLMFFRKTTITAVLFAAALVLPATAAFAVQNPGGGGGGQGGGGGYQCLDKTNCYPPNQNQNPNDPNCTHNCTPTFPPPQQGCDLHGQFGNCTPPVIKPPVITTCQWGNQGWDNQGYQGNQWDGRNQGQWNNNCDPVRPPVVTGCSTWNNDNQNWNGQGWNNNCDPKGCDGNWGTYRDGHGSWNQQQWNNNCDPPVTFCRDGVVTPPIQNLVYVTNTTGETVTVTLDGTYYWVQTKTGGHTDYLGPTTTTVTLTAGESISLAWHTNTGQHSWHWAGRNCTCNNHGHQLVS